MREYVSAAGRRLIKLLDRHTTVESCIVDWHINAALDCLYCVNISLRDVESTYRISKPCSDFQENANSGKIITFLLYLRVFSLSHHCPDLNVFPRKSYPRIQYPENASNSPARCINMYIFVPNLLKNSRPRHHGKETRCK